MNRVKSVKISSFLALLLTCFSVVLSVVILLWSSLDAEDIIKREQKRLLKRNHDTAAMVFEKELEHLGWVTRDLRVNIRQLLEKNADTASEDFKTGFASIYDLSAGENLDVMVFISFDGTRVTDVGSLFFDTSPIINFLKDSGQSVTASGSVYSIKDGGSAVPLNLILGYTPVNHPQTGEVLGRAYIGRIINGAPDIIREAAAETGSGIAFVSGGKMISSSDGFEMSSFAPEACASSGRIFNIKDGYSAYCLPLEIKGAETPLMIYQLTDNQSLALMKKQITGRAAAAVLLIIIMTAASVYGFRRLTARSLHYLIDYTHRISASGGTDEFVPTPVEEFNRLGDAVSSMNRELRETQAYLSNFLGFAKVPLIAWDTENRIVIFNKSMEELSGIDEAQALGENLEIIFACLTGDRLKELLLKAAGSSDTLSNFESMVKNVKSGEMKYILWNMSIAGTAEKSFGVVLQGIDITDRKSSEEKLLLASKVFENTIEAIYITNTRGVILSVNKAFLRITGFTEEEAIGNKTSILRSGRHANHFYKGLWNSLKETGTWQGEIWNRRKNGELYPATVNISSIRDSGGNISHFIGVMHDITERKKYEEQIKYQSHYDPLTNLPNRYLFQDRLSMAISRAKKNHNYVGLISIDIDRFKNVNDTLGHNVGDILLQKIADRIVGTVGESITVSRLGGDEYTVIIEDLSDKNRAVTVAYNVIKQLEKPFQVDDYELFLKCSAGLSFYPDDGDDVFTVAKNADAAMYRAKSKGRGMLQIYTTDFNDTAKDRLLIETKLNRALDNGEFEVYYQPKINLQTLELVGMEALIRWNNPDLGRVFPDMFIPITEETGLIVSIGQWVLKKSCEDLMRWRAMGYDLKVAVNLSLKQFIQKDLYMSVKNVLSETGMEPKHLELEITESTIMVDTENTRDILDKLSSLGITFAIDDFGTGFSSIGYLTRIPIDTIKIDKSFTQGIDTSEDSLSIVRSVIQLSRNLGIEVVAEGVENETHLRLLRELECDLAQGYYFSKPVPAAEFEKLLAGWKDSFALEIKSAK
ncbi:EAL domain-containing protein [Geovibrio thiophilus]|uniref:EAL domain-containing protein n=1 Tax=Geovibrio thiophilus TaxID=139438 RepID=A0A3R5XYK2_9BACT|nr:EAL domain-containing protein [Geovibrio thiophilus]QAR33913.1 EAL domain-containing protein [Geovibrio thiophilus]